MKEYRGITKCDFGVHFIKSTAWTAVRKLVGIDNFKRKRYLGEKILKGEQANALLYEKLAQGAPFMAARFGDGELRTIVHFIEKQLGIRKKYPAYIRQAICNNAGFFPNEEHQIDALCETFIDSCKQVDVLAVWFNLLEDYIYSSFGPQEKKCIYLKDLEPFWFDDPWTRALEGKKVLVIHPFTDTVRAQYAKRELLFQNKNVLPSFDLQTLKSVQSIGGYSSEYNTWFDALDYMYDAAAKIDFDIAIVGCGAYGLPLAARLKQSGKTAIHMGGVTQFLFGIKGNRWDVKKEYRSFYNEHWTRPNEKERPTSAQSVENGCYW